MNSAGASGMSSAGASGMSSAGASGMNSGGAGGTGGASGMAAGQAGTGGDIAVDPAQADGQVVAPWDQYCVATFTEDFDIVDSFGDLALQVQAGDRYLLGEEGFFGEITLVFVGSTGPVEIEIGGSDEIMPPFTSSCTGATELRIGVFADTVVYSDSALTSPLCTLQAGLTVPGSGVDYFVSGSGYQVMLKELAAECGGAAQGFVDEVSVSTPLIGYFGVPFASVLAPAR